MQFCPSIGEFIKSIGKLKGKQLKCLGLTQKATLPQRLTCRQSNGLSGYGSVLHPVQKADLQNVIDGSLQTSTKFKNCSKSIITTQVVITERSQKMMCISPRIFFGKKKILQCF